MIAFHKYFHWYYFQKRGKHAFIFSFAAFYWLFLSLTQPFGIHSEELFPLIINLLPVGLIWIIVIYSVDLIQEIISTEAQSWRITLDIILWAIKLFIGINLVFIYRAFPCDWECMDSLDYLQISFASFLLFILVYLPIGHYAKSVYLKSVFSGEEMKESANELQLGSGKNRMVLDLGNMVYIRSDDNHLDIYEIKDESLIKKVFRGTLQEMEQILLSKSPAFKRVHRSYIVNLNYFKHFGSSDGSYQLKLMVIEQEIKIPVSRKYKDVFKELL